MPGRLSADDVRQRLAGTRMPANPLDVDVSDLHHRMPPALVERLLPGLRPAGVLIPLIERGDELSVLLTERSADLKHHAGQVSFPGGGMEAGDADITATALRETHEEVGIPPGQIEVAGYLAPTPTVTGYAVTPVIGFVAADCPLRIDRTEVESAFEVPLEFLMEEANEEHSEREFQGLMLSVVTFHYGGYRIWGATAGMLRMLRAKLLINNML